MSEQVAGILVAHGRLAEGLLDAAEQISGSRGGLRAVANEGLTPEGLEERLASLTGDGPSVLFVDLPNGSCAFAARRLQRRQPDTAVVCGVNLPLLLDFIFHRSLPLDRLIERLREHVGVSIEHSTDADHPVSS